MNKDMKSPAFQFYPAEFIADENVVLMTNQEVGCYIKLMCYCWREGSIPADVNKIAKLCGEDGSAMAQLWSAIRSCFAQAEADPSRLVHPRLEVERQKQEEYKKERSTSGAKGAKARWEKAQSDSSVDGLANGSAIAQPMANDGSSSSSSSSTSGNKDTHTQSEEKVRKPKQKQPSFSEDERTLAGFVYYLLKEDGALPADDKFFFKQMQSARVLLKARSLDEWQKCFDWAKEQPRYRKEISSLGYLDKVVWPAYARREPPKNAVSALPGYMGNTVNDVLSRIKQIQGGGSQ